ncbi:hypothetical protein R1sor_024399 [Riccia sorocarpa]|uniref:Early light-induced protein n=1 Tax=Riccia sorocarpa TaxID=122646 RepID=A0ABD3GR64_9MARC
MTTALVCCNVPSAVTSPVLGSSRLARGLPQLSMRRRVFTPAVDRLTVRASQDKRESPLAENPKREGSFADEITPPLPSTKVEITEEQVKKNEQQEPLRVFDQSPVGQFARPESQRRPELGNTDFVSVMKFDGPAPETINGRLAMLGITWAFFAEVMTGRSVVDQLVNSTGLVWFLAVAPIFIAASFVPIFGWNESPDSRKFGPFNAKAERWNGRAAMIGFFSLLVTEQLVLNGPVFGFLHH